MVTLHRSSELQPRVFFLSLWWVLVTLSQPAAAGWHILNDANTSRSQATAVPHWSLRPGEPGGGIPVFPGWTQVCQLAGERGPNVSALYGVLSPWPPSVLVTPDRPEPFGETSEHPELRRRRGPPTHPARAPAPVSRPETADVSSISILLSSRSENLMEKNLRCISCRDSWKDIRFRGASKPASRHLLAAAAAAGVHSLSRITLDGCKRLSGIQKETWTVLRSSVAFRRPRHTGVVDPGGTTGLLLPLQRKLRCVGRLRRRARSSFKRGEKAASGQRRKSAETFLGSQTRASSIQHGSAGARPLSGSGVHAFHSVASANQNQSISN